VLGFFAAVQCGSGGYAIAAGLALFIVVIEVGIRHFGETLGFPMVLIISGLALLAIAARVVRLPPRPAPAGRRRPRA
jgi:hypothetical protein